MSQLHTLTFAVQPVAGAAGKGPMPFEGVAYSGGVIPAYGWHGDVAIDLSQMRNADGDALPVLVDHKRSVGAIAGRGRIFRFASPGGVTGLRIEGEITESTEAGKQIAALLAEGYPLQMSVGMSANFREVSEPLAVNGQTVSVSGVFEQPFIREVSFVPIGADPATEASVVRFSQVLQPSPAKERTTMSRTAEDEALIAGLKEQVNSLQAQLTQAREQRRAEQLAALFADIGRDAPQGDAAKPYMEMSEAAFAAFAADIKAVANAGRPQPNPALFSSQALGRAGAGKPDATPRDALLAAVDRMSGRPVN